GKGLYGVPFFLVGSLPMDMFYTVDGDLGRLMVDMGIVGVVVFGTLIWVTSRITWKHLITSRGTEREGIAIAVSAAFLTCIITWPSGSPFLGIPMGPMTWF